MNIRDLIYTIAVAKHKNFSQAALACNVSQPTLSIQIKKLEEELGVSIFIRKANEVEPTDLGLKVIESAERVISEIEHIQQIAHEFNDVEKTSIKIGMTPTLAPYLTRYFRDMLHAFNSDISVALIEDKPLELAEMVEKKDIDIALISRKNFDMLYGRDNIKEVSFTSLWMEPLYLGVCEGHLLASQPAIYAKDVPEELLIRFGISFGYDLEKNLPDVHQNMKKKIGFDVSAARFETVCRHIVHSDDCTIINAIAAEQFKTENWKLEFIEFLDQGNLRDLGIISKSSFSTDPMLEFISQYVNDDPPAGALPAQSK